MAIAFYRMRTVKRTEGRSALAASAYIACQRLKDRLTGEVFDFRRKAGLHCAFVVIPNECKVDREVLWNAAEAAETRSNSVVARSTILALPHELDEAHYASLVEKHARYLVERHGDAVALAIHLPGKEGDERNFHAHLLLTTREVAIGPAGDVICGKKTRELDEHRTGSAIINEWRLHWQDCVNEALHHLGVQIDVRSYAKQGLDRVAGEHLGPARTNLDRQATREILEEVRTARLIYLDAVSTDGRWRRFGLEARRRRMESVAAVPSKQEFCEYLERQEEAQTDEPLFTSVGKVTDPLIFQDDSTETMLGVEGTAAPDGASAGRTNGPVTDNKVPMCGEGEPRSNQAVDCPSDPASKAGPTTVALGSLGNDGAEAQENAGDGPEIPLRRTPSLETSGGLKSLYGSPVTQGEQDQQSLIPHGEEADNSVKPIAHRGSKHVPEAVGQLRHCADQAHSNADFVGPENVTAPIRNMIERLRAESEAAREREAIKRSIDEQIAADRRSRRSPSLSSAANSPAANPLTGGPAMELPLMHKDAGNVGGVPRSRSSKPTSKEAPTQSPQVGSANVSQSDGAKSTQQTALASEPTVAELIAKGQGRPIRSVPSQDASVPGARESAVALLEGKASASVEAPSKSSQLQNKVVSPAPVLVPPPTPDPDMTQQDASSDIKGVGQVSGEKQQLPSNSAARVPIPNNSRTEPVNKPAVAENSRQTSKPAVDNAPKSENTAQGTKPARDNSGSAASKPATPAPAPSAQAQRPAATPTDTRSAQTQTPRRNAQAPAAQAVRPTAPQAGSPKEPAAAKVKSAPAATPAKAPPPSPASAQTPAPASAARPEPARQADRAETSAGKPDATKAAPETKAPARPEKTSVAPKPSTATSGPARTPGERSGESSAAKPAKEKAEIRVGDPLSPTLPKQMEPIRVEGKKPPKKSKRRGKDDGRDL